MATFGLVHGAWHGAWCWAHVVPLLERQGHRAVPIDLPAEDPTAGLTAYAELVASALTDEDDDVVVVGHSLGAATIPLVARLRPVRRLVFLAALVPEPGGSATDRYAADPDVFPPGFAGSTVTLDDGASAWRDEAAARRCLFHDCSDADAAWAFAQLRPQSPAPRLESWPDEPLPRVEVVSIVCRDDRCISPAWGRLMSRAQLGVAAIELEGGHSPVLSRPADLAEALCAGL